MIKELPKFEEVNKWGYFEYHENEVIKNLTKFFWKEASWWSEIPLVPGVTNAIKTFRDENIHVVFLTSPWSGCKGWIDARYSYLLKHFGLGFEPRLSYIPTHLKYLVDGHVMIDDKPSHLVNWKNNRTYGEAILWKAPWNKEYSDKEDLYVNGDKWNIIDGWNEATIKKVLDSFITSNKNNPADYIGM